MRATDLTLDPEQARTWRIAWSEERGAHGVAVRDLLPGELILAETSRATVLHDRWRKRICHVCFRQAEDLTACPQCGQIWTCSTVCQEHLATVHTRECKALGRLARAGDLDQVSLRLVVRLLATGPRPGEATPMEHLISNRDAVPDYRLGVYEHQARLLLELLPPDLRCSADEIIDLCCRIHVNSFTISHHGADNRGLAMNDLAPLLNHACAPNCDFVQMANRMSIRTIEAVPAGQELTVSYIHLLRCRRARQAKLRTGHYFTCTCDRCAAPGPDLLAAFCCPERGCGEVLERAPGAPVHRCASGGHEHASAGLRRQESALRGRFEDGTWGSRDPEERRWARQRLEQLVLEAEGFLHPLHELRHVMEETLAELCAADGDPRAALLHLARVREGMVGAIPRYHGRFARHHQHVASQFWRLSSDAGEPPAARADALERCLAALGASLLVRTIAHGAEHPANRELLDRMRQVYDARHALRHG